MYITSCLQYAAWTWLLLCSVCTLLHVYNVQSDLGCCHVQYVHYFMFTMCSLTLVAVMFSIVHYFMFTMCSLTLVTVMFSMYITSCLQCAAWPWLLLCSVCTLLHVYNMQPDLGCCHVQYCTLLHVEDTSLQVYKFIYIYTRRS